MTLEEEEGLCPYQASSHRKVGNKKSNSTNTGDVEVRGAGTGRSVPEQGGQAREALAWRLTLAPRPQNLRVLEIRPRPRSPGSRIQVPV